MQTLSLKPTSAARPVGTPEQALALPQGSRRRVAAKEFVLAELERLAAGAEDPG
jgi:hypothetical protein